MNVVREHRQYRLKRLKKIICIVKRPNKIFEQIYNTQYQSFYLSIINNKIFAKNPKITSDVCLCSNIQISTGFSAG